SEARAVPGHEGHVRRSLSTDLIRDRGVAAAGVVDISVHCAQGVLVLPCRRQLSSTYRRSSLRRGHLSPPGTSTARLRRMARSSVASFRSASRPTTEAAY